MLPGSPEERRKTCYEKVPYSRPLDARRMRRKGIRQGWLQPTASYYRCPYCRKWHLTNSEKSVHSSKQRNEDENEEDEIE